jgi:hypothetical protein
MIYYLHCPQFWQNYGGELLRKGQNDPINDTINDTIKNKFIQSYRIPSASICVHLRLIFVSLSDRTRKIQFILSHIIIKSGSVSVPSGILRGRMSSRHV